MFLILSPVILWSVNKTASQLEGEISSYLLIVWSCTWSFSCLKTQTNECKDCGQLTKERVATDPVERDIISNY